MAKTNIQNKLVKLVAIFTVLSLLFVVSGCKSKTPPKPQVTLNYYKLFENSESLNPVFKAFEQQNPHIKINYKKFTDPESYEKLLLNEFAEGEGPDIFSMPANWIQNNSKKIQPADPAIIPLEAFENTFLTFINEDLLLVNQATQQKQVYGLPLGIDTLVLFYNQEHYDRRIPEQGKPSTTWEGFSSDIRKLRSLNDSNGIVRAATALGRTDNTTYGFDVWLNLLLQNDIDVLNKDGNKAIFSNNQDTEEVTKYYTDFATKGSPTYTWDTSTQSVQPTPVELFATGRLSTLFGYSFTYKQVVDQIAIAKRNGEQVIELDQIKITKIPQVSSNSDDHQVVTSYFAETVSRTSKHPNEAWSLLRFMIQPQNLQSFYTQGGFKPSPRRDMIETQRANSVYRPFIEQLSIAKSLRLPERARLEKQFNQSITNFHQGVALAEVIRNLQDAFNQIISLTGS